MTNTSTLILCKNCGTRKIFSIINRESRFCLFCFKNTPNKVFLTILETTELKDFLEAKVKSLLFRRFKSLTKIGWQPSQKTKNGVFLFRKLDKEDDSYAEIIKDYKTRKIIHESKAREKLSEHTGHGSAKFK